MKEHDERSTSFEINTTINKNKDDVLNINNIINKTKESLFESEYDINTSVTDEKSEKLQKMNQKNDIIGSHMPEEVPSEIIDDLSVKKKTDDMLSEIESDIEKIASDVKRASRYKKVTAAAKSYQGRKNTKYRVQLLFALRDAMALYLMERSDSSYIERKTLAESLIGKIDAYAEKEGLFVNHDPSYILDDLQMSDAQIDMEILLANNQLYKTGSSLKEVSHERRELFKKKIADTRMAKRIQNDIQRKDSKKQLAFEAAGLIPKEETAYERASREAVMAYARLHDIKEEAAVAMLFRMRLDGTGDIDAKEVKFRQIEMILLDILSWKEEDFAFDKMEDFLHRKGNDQNELLHFKKLKAKLDLVKSAGALIDEVDKGDRFGFEDDMINELRTRISLYKEIGREYDERLSLMSSPYYALITGKEAGAFNDLLDSANIGEEKEIPGMDKSVVPPQAFLDYKNLMNKKGIRDDEYMHLPTEEDPTYRRGKSISNLLKIHRERTESEQINARSFDMKNIEDLRKKRMAAFSNAVKNLYGEKEAQKVMLDLKDLPVSLDKKEESKNINQSMKQIEGRAFIPVLKDTKRIGFWGKLKNMFGAGLRYAVAASLGPIATLAGNILSMALHKDPATKNEKTQAFRSHDTVPGMKDERFTDEDITNEDDETRILEDTRRGPMIWEKLTAGDPEDPPELSIMSHQPVTGSNTATKGLDNAGHSFMALSYSRYNKATGRKERYRLQVGLYFGAGSGNRLVQMMGSTGAMTLGQLRNDNYSAYEIGRRFQINPGDVNRIIRAMSSYAEGGYGLYKRNCATFVADMAKLANLPIIDEMKEEQFDMPLLGNLGLNFANGVGYTGYKAGENNIADKMGKNDISYMGYGQKLSTEQDLRRYQDTAKNTDVMKTGYTPGAMGEILRGTKEGELISKPLSASNEISSIRGGIDKVKTSAISLMQALRDRLSEDKKIEDTEFAKAMGEFISQCNKITENDQFNEMIKTPTQVKQVHKGISDIMKKSNAYFAGRLQNDALLQNDFLTFLGLCETTLFRCDQKYEETIHKDYTGDLKFARKAFNKNNLKLYYKDTEKNKKENVSQKISPALYEGYLVMGKKPHEIARIIDRQSKLALKEKNKESLTDSEKAELEGLKRERAVAEDFAAASNYYLNTSRFTKSNLKFAFSDLPRMEQEEGTGGTVVKKGQRISDYHQAAIMETIFSGLGKLKIDWENDEPDAIAKKLAGHMISGGKAKNKTLEDILEAFVRGRQQLSEENKKKSGNDLVTEFIITTIGNYISFAFADQDLAFNLQSVMDVLEKNKDLRGILLSAIKHARGESGEEEKKEVIKTEDKEENIDNINNINNSGSDDDDEDGGLWD
jgi:hypothetical protein